MGVVAVVRFWEATCRIFFQLWGVKIDAIATDYLGRVRLRLLEESECGRTDGKRLALILFVTHQLRTTLGSVAIAEKSNDPKRPEASEIGPSERERGSQIPAAWHWIRRVHATAAFIHHARSRAGQHITPF